MSNHSSVFFSPQYKRVSISSSSSDLIVRWLSSSSLSLSTSLSLESLSLLISLLSLIIIQEDLYHCIVLRGLTKSLSSTRSDRLSL
jgi:hypothetical protein